MQQARSTNMTTTPAAELSEVEVIFFDCDDCLYQNEWRTADRITVAIAQYTEQKLGVSKEKAYSLYKEYGTCLKGLIAEGLLLQTSFSTQDEATTAKNNDDTGKNGEELTDKDLLNNTRPTVEQYLFAAHDIDYSDIKTDPLLREIILNQVRPNFRKWVFTASTREHAGRCMEALGIRDIFEERIVDTRSCELETKYAPSSFAAAMQAAGLTDPSKCILFDDSVKNITAAKKAGWLTVLVGKVDRDTGGSVCTPAEADRHIATLHDLPEACPELCVENGML